MVEAEHQRRPLYVHPLEEHHNAGAGTKVHIFSDIRFIFKGKVKKVFVSPHYYPSARRELSPWPVGAVKCHGIQFVFQHLAGMGGLIRLQIICYHLRIYSFKCNQVEVASNAGQTL